MKENKDLNELLSIAKSINQGNYDLVDVVIDSESELFGIAEYFSEAHKKLSTVSEVIDSKSSDIPLFETVLKTVINDSKTASNDILSLVDKIGFNIDEMKEVFRLVKDYYIADDLGHAKGLLDKAKLRSVTGVDHCYDIISSLEFKNENIDKISESLNILSNLEERIANVLIKLGVKQHIIDIDMLDTIKDKREILQNQDLVDRLLKEFGV